jgi:hypothetical protein
MGAMIILFLSEREPREYELKSIEWVVIKGS